MSKIFGAMLPLFLATGCKDTCDGLAADNTVIDFSDSTYSEDEKKIVSDYLEIVDKPYRTYNPKFFCGFNGYEIEDDIEHPKEQRDDYEGKFTAGVYHPSTGTLSLDSKTLQLEVFEFGPSISDYSTVIHELGHYADYGYGSKMNPKLSKTKEWKQVRCYKDEVTKDGEVLGDLDNCVVSPKGIARGNREEFADAFSAYANPIAGIVAQGSNDNTIAQLMIMVETAAQAENIGDDLIERLIPSSDISIVQNNESKKTYSDAFIQTSSNTIWAISNNGVKKIQVTSPNKDLIVQEYEFDLGLFSNEIIGIQEINNTIAIRDADTMYYIDSETGNLIFPAPTSKADASIPLKNQSLDLNLVDGTGWLTRHSTEFYAVDESDTKPLPEEFVENAINATFITPYTDDSGNSYIILRNHTDKNWMIATSIYQIEDKDDDFNLSRVFYEASDYSFSAPFLKNGDWNMIGSVSNGTSLSSNSGQYAFNMNIVYTKSGDILLHKMDTSNLEDSVFLFNHTFNRPDGMIQLDGQWLGIAQSVFGEITFYPLEW
ncbi:MAG: hypothetical protein H7A33_02480 [Deltaproteobacteria bacterium]|nr:hypothetical protein [Deltaproteobacteria bacterium]